MIQEHHILFRTPPLLGPPLSLPVATNNSTTNNQLGLSSRLSRSSAMLPRFNARPSSPGIMASLKLHYTTLHYTTLHYTALHCTALHYTTLHYTTLHYTALHCTALHFTTLHYTALHCTTRNTTMPFASSRPTSPAPHSAD